MTLAMDLARWAVELQPTEADLALARRSLVDTVAVAVADHQPETGLQGKFSLEYAAATALLDEHQGFTTFTDAAVRRPEAQRLVRRVEVQLTDGGDWLLAGDLESEVFLGNRVLHARQQFPPGSPQRPPTEEELMRKVTDCLAGTAVAPGAIDWSSARAILRAHV